MGIAIGAVAAPLVLLAPALARALWALPETVRVASGLISDSAAPLAASLVAAVLAVFLTIGAARLAAIVLSTELLRRRGGQPGAMRWLFGLAAIPALCGVLPIAFLVQALFLLEPTLNPFENVRFPGISVLTAMTLHSLRYIPLVVWLFWLDLEASPITLRRYLVFHEVGGRAAAAGTYWPTFRYLALVLSFLLFIDTYQEMIALRLLLRPSPGTNSEFISHYLLRSYFEILPMHSAAVASNALIAAGLCVGAIALATAVLTIKAVDFAWFRRLTAMRDSRSRPRPAVSGGAALAVSMALAPLSLGALLSMLHPTWKLLPRELAFTLGLTLLTAALALAWSVFAGSCLRIAAYRRSVRPERALAIVTAVGLSLGFLPWTAMALGIFQLSVALPFGPVITPAVWVVCQLLKVTPLMLALTGTIVFSIPDSEVAFQRVAGASLKDFVYYSVVQPFRAAHVAFFIFAFIQVWNETNVSAAFQSRVMSFSEITLIAVNGRGASFEVASTLTLFAIVVAALLGVAWIVGTGRGKKESGIGA